jgi:hypothetical protein
MPLRDATLAACQVLYEVEIYNLVNRFAFYRRELSVSATDCRMLLRRKSTSH